MNGSNGVDVHHNASVNLEKNVRIKLVHQLLDRLVNQRLRGGGDDDRVLVVRLEIADLIDRDQLNGPPLRD